MQACVRTGTALEIDAQPERMDLPDVLVRRAVEAGAPPVVSSDAHTPDELGYIEEFGISVARRGWACVEQVLNAQPLARQRARLKSAQ